MSDFRELVITWNNTWRYDFWFRQKNSIVFNSTQHRELSPIDIKFMFIEELIMEEEARRNKVFQHRNEKYKKTGVWLEPRLGQTKEQLFDDIDLDNIE